MTHPHGSIQRTERVYEGRVVSLRLDHVELADGQIVTREIIEHGGAVAMVPIDDEDNVYFVRQYRPATGRELLEIPAGGVEPGEDPIKTAERELQEEVGYFPGKLVSLGTFYPVPGYSSEIIHLFLARDLSPAHLPADPHESLTVEKITFTHALDRVDRGEIEDGKTIAGLLRVSRYLAGQ